MLNDLPAGGIHLYSKPNGMAYVMVGGEVLIEGGQHTGAMPGQIVTGG